MAARIFLAFLVGLAVVIHTWPGITGPAASVGSFLDAHATIVTALATVVIAAFTFALFRATHRTYKHSVASERAYVTMSHRSGPGYGSGLEIDRARNEVRITIEVKNSGRTPAHVNDVFLARLVRPKGQEPPSEPRYPPPQEPARPTSAFLVARDSFVFWRTFDGISGDLLDKIASGDETLWVYGYVDYTDASGQRHRGGYGRQYAPDRTDNNLIFMPQSAYNYDRPL